MNEPINITADGLAALKLENVQLKAALTFV